VFGDWFGRFSVVSHKYPVNHGAEFEMQDLKFQKDAAAERHEMMQFISETRH
jgi:hypothetical protein